MLRPYQQGMKDGVYHAWNFGAKSVVAVGPTGMGKTVLFSDIAKDITTGCVIAHRKELVGQISMALAAAGVMHNIIAPKSVAQAIMRKHIKKFGRSYYSPTAQSAVAAVDTLLLRAEDPLIKPWCQRVTHVTVDECHHCLDDNKWGKALKLFPNAKILGVTATPLRADRKSLHVSQGGVFDYMVVGPTMRELIDQGYLCDYKIYGPPESYDVSKIKVSSATGDFSLTSLREENAKSTITGDIVQTYIKLAKGKQAIAFLVDVQTAVDTALEFQKYGITAEAISAKTPDSVRDLLVEKFANGEIDILCNVDLFGEGFDVPAVEVVIMGRPTHSYGLYVQQFGRALRLANGKLFGIIIDHVGNVIRHGLPDREREWTLFDEEYGKRKKRDPNEIPVTTCLECFGAYEAVTKTCPYCDHRHEPDPEDRSRPEQVQGDLIEFSAGLLDSLRGKREEIDSDFVKIPHGAEANGIIANSARKRHRENQEAQFELRQSIAIWAGIQRDVHKRPDSEIYRRFYIRFQIDILEAQTLKKKEANEMNDVLKGLMK